MIQGTLSFAKLPTETPCTRANGPISPRPAFRQRDALLCAWCLETWFEPGPHVREKALYCSAACRAHAHRATKTERSRRREESRKRMGMDTAAKNNSDQRAIARWAALECLGARGPSIVSHVRDWCAKRGIELEWEKPWTGSLFQDRWFRATGRTVAAFHLGSSARHVKEWELSSAGSVVYVRMRGME